MDTTSSDSAPDTEDDEYDARDDENDDRDDDRDYILIDDEKIKSSQITELKKQVAKNEELDIHILDKRCGAIFPKKSKELNFPKPGNFTANDLGEFV